MHKETLKTHRFLEIIPTGRHDAVTSSRPHTQTHKQTHTHIYIEKGRNALLRKVGLHPTILLYYKTQTSTTQRYIKCINTYMHTQWIMFETPGTASQLQKKMDCNISEMMCYKHNAELQGAIPGTIIRGNSVTGAVFSHTMVKNRCLLFPSF